MELFLHTTYTNPRLIIIISAVSTMTTKMADSTTAPSRQHPPTRTARHTILLTLILTYTLLLSTALTTTNAFSFQLPQIRMPWDNNNSNPSSSSKQKLSPKSPIQPQEKIVVFGGTGGVGQLVTRKLRARPNTNYKVTVVAREAARARGVLEDEGVDVVELNLVGEEKASDDDLRNALSDATGIVITVGTTAFPTKRWSGGNTPQAIDQEAVTRIANIAAESSSLRRMVLLTSVGVQRTKQMPFLILNLFGVLDAKRSGEDAVKNAASKGNFSYSIVRPGRLVGGPYTNLDLAKLFQIEGGAENGVTLEKGDTLLGDCKRDVCAEAVLQCLENVDCVDVDFSMISNEEKALVDGEWGEAFVGMRGEQ